MDIKTFLTLLAAIIVAAVGLTEWAKGLFKKAPPWLFSVIPVVICFALAMVGLQVELFFSVCLLLGVLSVALAEIGYQIVLKGITGILQSAVDRVKTEIEYTRKAPPPNPPLG